MLPSIMVIEDEEMLLEAIRKKLELNNFLVMVATSAEAALISLDQASQLPNLIWLDFNLKDMDGLEFMKRLKANDAWKNIPVIVVSNSDNEERVQKVLALGAKLYILKAEHRLDDIIATVSQVIKESQTQA